MDALLVTVLPALLPQEAVVDGASTVVPEAGKLRGSNSSFGFVYLQAGWERSLAEM